jgi:hypothetical protein
MQLPTLYSKEISASCSVDAGPQDVIPEARLDLVYRLAADYEHNWRSSGLTVNRYGLQPLAMGVLSCFTLNFTVQKVAALSLHLWPYRSRSDHNGLLKWRTWPSPHVITTVSLGPTQVIVTDRMDLAISLVHEHISIIMMKELRHGRDYVYLIEELNTAAA